MKPKTKTEADNGGSKKAAQSKLQQDKAAEGKTGPPQMTVVGIGASAGGLSALRDFFAHMPEKTGLAFVVVVHLSPEHESQLVGLLQPRSKMPVTQVTRTVPLKPDHVYVIPPARNLNVIDTHLRLSDLEDQRGRRAPIDHFFRTLSETHGSHAVGIILTGTGSDGSLGIRNVKEKGGLTIVQAPEDAEYDGMPRSAIATGMADLVLPVGEMASHILRFAGTEPVLATEGDGEPVDGDDLQHLRKIFAQIRALTRRDFTGYKRSTVLRRIRRRMQLLHQEQLGPYLELLRKDPEEVKRLSDDLLITVTNFFRDSEVFEALERDVVPQLFRQRGPGERIRIWSIGCATGEEAYSLAMLLLEEAGRGEAVPQLQVFATDLHEHSLRTAREGLYPEAIEAEVSPERMRRFFVRESGGYRVRKEVREIVLFAPHDLLKDPPFSRLDLISCRNMLIYLQPEVQENLLQLFHYALNPNGLLLLGKSETIDRSDLFRVESKEIRLYQPRDVTGSGGRLPVFPAKHALQDSRMATSQRSEVVIRWGALHEKMVERYAPPSILLNADHHVIHSSEHAGRYLRYPAGEPTTSVFKLLPDQLAMELRTALYAARDQAKPQRSKPIPITVEGNLRNVVLRVHMAEESKHDLQGLILVIFDEVEVSEHLLESAEARTDATIRELEAELEMEKQRLRQVIEENETSQEEMGATNEELQSANEELHSTMEELETSKEELQSMNEELVTLNQENRHKVEELGQITSDQQNLLASMEIATVFLDRELRIMRFTPRLGELFNVWHGDRGRPLSDLTHRLGYKDLLSDATQVLDRLVPVEREVESEQGQWYLCRVLPYRADERIDGVVITFVDITRRKEAEDALRESQRLLAQELEVTRRLHEMTMQVVTASELEEALQEILSAAIELQETDMGDVQLLTPDETGLEILASRGLPESHLAALRLVKIEEDKVSGRAIRERRRVMIPDVDAEGATIEPYPHLAAMAGYRAVQATPLISHSGKILGVLSTNHRRPHSFSERDERLLDLLAQHAASLIDRFRAEEALKELNATLEGRVKERTEQVRTMVSRLTMAEHAERRRISEVLHDDLQQLLFSIQMKLTFVLNHIETDQREALRKNAEEAYSWIKEAIESTRRLTVDISPAVLHHEGLVEAIGWLPAHMKESHGLKVDLSAGNVSPVTHEDMRVLLFQVVRELLFNVVKHAKTDRARVELEEEDGFLVMKVADEGKGFDPKAIDSGSKEGFGLFAIRSRLDLVGGRMEIASQPAQGTRIKVLVPLSAVGGNSRP